MSPRVYRTLKIGAEITVPFLMLLVLGATSFYYIGFVVGAALMSAGFMLARMKTVIGLRASSATAEHAPKPARNKTSANVNTTLLISNEINRYAGA